MGSELLALVSATWHMLMSLLDLVFEVIGVWVTLCWMWRKAFAQSADSEKVSDGDAAE